MRGMLKLVFGIIGIAILMTGCAEESLPDIEARFKKRDAQIRAIDTDDSNSLNYMKWIAEALECKDDLNLRKEMLPWLDGLAQASINNWKLQEAVAFGYGLCGREYRRYQLEPVRKKALQCVERAWAQMDKQSVAIKARANLADLYVSLLLLGRMDDPERLQYKTSDLPSDTKWPKRDYNKNSEMIFYPCPASYVQSANDGELIRWLLENEQLRKTKKQRWKADRTKADFAVLIAGVQRSMPHDPKGLFRELLSMLPEDKTLFWEYRDAPPIKRTLPKGYQYISRYRKLMEEGDSAAPLTLGEIWINRCQLERAARCYELAGIKDRVRSIREKQGRLSMYNIGQPAGKPAQLHYLYRNGNQLDVDVYRINAGTNLIQRLKAGTVKSREISLLRGFGAPSEVDPEIVEDKPALSFSVALDPHPDHWDLLHTFEVPVLSVGIYLLKTRMEGGNESETILCLYDSVLQAGVQSDGDESDSSGFYILSDALTGRPKSNEALYFVELSGGTKRVEDKFVDYPYAVEKLTLGKTDSNGIYVEPSLTTDKWNTSSFILSGLESNPFATRCFSLGEDSSRDFRTDELFITTDRPVYRPGETGFIKFWQAGSTNRYQLEVKDRSSDRLELTVGETEKRQVELLPDRFGGSDVSFVVPNKAALGNYSIEASSGGKRIWHSFSVEEYRAPEFNLSARMESNELLEIEALYAYGAPVQEGEVEATIWFSQKDAPQWFPDALYDFYLGDGYEWHGDQYFSGKRGLYRFPWDYELFVFTVNGTLDKKGRIIINLAEHAEGRKMLKQSAGTYSVGISVTDQAKKKYKETIQIPFNDLALPICVSLDKAFYSAGERAVCRIEGDAGGDELLLELTTLSGTNRTVLFKKSMAEREAELVVLPPGYYELRAVTGERASHPFGFSVLGGTPQGLSPKKAVRLVREKGVYSPGENVRLLIQTDQPGRYVYLFDQKTGVDSWFPKMIQMIGTEQVVEIRLPIGEAGQLRCSAMTVVDAESSWAAVGIPLIDPALPVGHVDIEVDKSDFRPGVHVELNLRAIDSEERGYPCSLSVSVYNKALDLVAGNRRNDIRSILFSSWYPDILYSSGLSFSRQDGMVEAEYPEGVMRSLNPFGRSPFSQHYLEAIDATDWTSFNIYMGLFADIESRPDYDDEFSYASYEVEYSDSSVACADVAGPDAPAVRIRKDFRESAYLNASVVTDEEGRATVDFIMPDQLAEWKVLVWAMDTNYAGSGETSLTCSKEFVLQLNTPRFMIEGDVVEISGSLRNHTTSELDCTVSCAATGNAAQVTSPFSLEAQQLMPDEERMMYWDIQARNAGTAHITGKAHSSTESDGMERSMPVLPHGMIKRGGTSGMLNASQSNAVINVNWSEGVDIASSSIQLNCSYDMVESLAGALPYLAEYPYGCAEQTLNRFLPSLVVLRAMDQLGLELKTFSSSMPESRKAVYEREEILKRAQAGIDRLQAAQNYEGLLDWSLLSSYRTDLLTSAWVLRGLEQAARNPDLEVDRKKIADGLGSLLDRMNKVMEPDCDIEPSDAMIVAVCSEVDSERYEKFRSYRKKRRATVFPKFIAYLSKHADELSLYGKVLLAYACELQGDATRRDKLVRFINQYLESDKASGTCHLRTENTEWWYWYNDAIEIHAWYLKLLNRIDPHGPETAGIAHYLIQNRVYGDHWKSTRDTAICIEALCEYAENNRMKAGEPVYQVLLNGSPVPHSAPGYYTFTDLTPGTNQLTLKSKSDKTFFYDASWSAYTRETPITAESCDLISISRAYYRESIGPDDNKDDEAVPLLPDDLIAVGETIEVVLTLKANQPLEYLMAEDFKPAGFECMDEESGWNYSGLRCHREFHDERVSFYINNIRSGESTIRYSIRAEHAGTMCAMPATVELMYEPRQAANTDEAKLNVKR